MQAVLAKYPMTVQCMTVPRKSTRQRLVQAALQLFAVQGVTETTTRQIAELADVNEVTLFRQFGSKHGLLLAVLEEAEIFTQLGEDLGQQANQIRGSAQALQAYADGYLRALEQIPEFVRSLVGEAGQYPIENQQAIGRGLSQIHRYTVQYLATVMAREQMPGSEQPDSQQPDLQGAIASTQLPPARLASLLNTLLLGYAVIEFTTQYHDLWADREAFIADLVALFLPGSLPDETRDARSVVSPAAFTVFETNRAIQAFEVVDLPSPLVRSILQKARKSGAQDYALVYVLFAAGLRPGEMVSLQRSHSIYDQQQHVLQVIQGAVRQVPLNQWIMGHRYGSYIKNPLTQWLKSRKDDQPAMFLNEAGRSMSEVELRLRWQELTSEFTIPTGQAPAIEQAQQTWCVEMLMRGISLEDLSILSGCDQEQLQPYLRRSQQKAALERATQLDQRPGSKPDVAG
jgi:AcrR family transcriptional regulator